MVMVEGGYHRLQEFGKGRVEDTQILVKDQKAQGEGTSQRRGQP